MRVDAPRCDQAALGIDFFAPATQVFANGLDAPVDDANVCQVAVCGRGNVRMPNDHIKSNAHATSLNKLPQDVTRRVSMPASFKAFHTTVLTLS